MVSSWVYLSGTGSHPHFWNRIPPTFLEQDPTHISGTGSHPHFWNRIPPTFLEEDPTHISWNRIPPTFMEQDPTHIYGTGSHPHEVTDISLRDECYLLKPYLHPIIQITKVAKVNICALYHSTLNLLKAISWLVVQFSFNSLRLSDPFMQLLVKIMSLPPSW